ncbi:MAG: RNA polymerase sigma factor [Planctomycetes bacterium]|nr:RNA polymerase sigma factor [Planctomycetota bacterium]MCB9828840.1 RNA polymerase sigma factor [Planctomycetota bacterium]
MDHDPDQALMRRLQGGDDSAFEVLVHKYQGMVLALARRYLGSRYTELEDVAQQVFVRVYRGRMGYRPEAKVKTWLYSITVNACLNEIRRIRTEKHKSVRSFTAVFGDDEEGGYVVPDARSEEVSDGLEHEEVRRRVEAAVDALPEQQRLALVLTRFHGQSYQDVADTLGTTIPAVKSLLTRAREHLKRSLEDLLEHAPGLVSRGTSPA